MMRRIRSIALLNPEGGGLCDQVLQLDARRRRSDVDHKFEIPPEPRFARHLVGKQNIVSQRCIQLEEAVLLNQAASNDSHQFTRIHLHTFLYSYASLRSGKPAWPSCAIVQNGIFSESQKWLMAIKHILMHSYLFVGAIVNNVRPIEWLICRVVPEYLVIEFAEEGSDCGIQRFAILRVKRLDIPEDPTW